MIVIGVDVHKHSLTAVVVDEVGRLLAECTRAVDGGVVEWAESLADDRLWALGDCDPPRLGRHTPAMDPAAR